MTDPARIEAAARELVTDWATIDAPTPQQLEYAHKRAGEILAAAYPELANGTAWLAPMEATDEMLEAARGAWSWPDAWTAMRDAHLKAQGSDA